MRDYYARRTTSIESRLWEGGSAGWAEVAATRLPPPRPDTAGAERATSPPVREGPLLRRCVLLLTVRRADTNEAIGNALVAKANGAGHRTIATGPGSSETTVRRWLRDARGAHAAWRYQRGVQKVVTSIGTFTRGHLIAASRRPGDPVPACDEDSCRILSVVGH